MMKNKYFLVPLLLSICCSTFAAQNDRNYAVSESGSAQKIEVYNDGQNTYIQAVPGLIIKGATADGDRLIVQGTPKEIQGWKDGKQIVLSRFDAPQVTRAPSAAQQGASADTVALNAKLAQITTQLSALMHKGQQADPVEAAPAVAAPPPPPMPTWEIKSDDLAINPTLRRWAAAANWQVAWEIPVDYPVTVTDKFVGTFEEAVTRVVSAYAGADYPPKACFYDNHVVRIVRFLGNGKECDSQ